MEPWLNQNFKGGNNMMKMKTLKLLSMSIALIGICGSNVMGMENQNQQPIVENPQIKAAAEKLDNSLQKISVAVVGDSIASNIAPQSNSGKIIPQVKQEIVTAMAAGGGVSGVDAKLNGFIFTAKAFSNNFAKGKRLPIINAITDLEKEAKGKTDAEKEDLIANAQVAIGLLLK